MKWLGNDLSSVTLSVLYYTHSREVFIEEKWRHVRHGVSDRVTLGISAHSQVLLNFSQTLDSLETTKEFLYQIDVEGVL